MWQHVTHRAIVWRGLSADVQMAWHAAPRVRPDMMLLVYRRSAGGCAPAGRARTRCLLMRSDIGMAEGESVAETANQTRELRYGDGRAAADPPESWTSRLEKIVGADGVAALSASTVVVFGLGGVGGSCAEALVRGGVGTLVVIDGDVVQESNLNRQAIAFRSTLGQRKVDAFAAMARNINPDIRVIPFPEFVLPDRVPSLIEGAAAQTGSIDWMVDAIDTVSTKLAIASYAQAHDLSLVSSMGAANKTDPTAFRFSDLFETENCPLCRAMRKGARKQGVTRLRVLYSTERVDAQPGRENLGTMSYAPPIMGQMLAGDVICGLLGMGWQ